MKPKCTKEQRSGTINLQKNRLKKITSYLLLAVLIFTYRIAVGQPLPAPSPTAAQAMNTGVKFGPFNPETVGNLDANWKVSTSPGGGINALVVSPPSAACCGWSANQTVSPGSNPPYSQWITYPYMSCGNPADYSCQPAFTDMYFERSFFLANGVFQADWLVYASGYLVDVEINLSPIYSNTLSYGSNPPCDANTAKKFKVCKYFKQGWNTVRFHIKTPQSIPNNCKFAGLRVESWPGTYPTIAGPTPVCLNTTYSFSIPQAPAGSTYTWTFPAGWINALGVPNYTISKKATNLAASGIVTLNINATAGCIGAAQFSVSVDPKLNVSASPSVICKGAFSTINASNGVLGTYTIIGNAINPPAPTTNTSPPFVVNPSVNSLYIVKAKTPAGCTYSATTNVTVLNGPNISINSSNPSNAVCSGQPLILTATFVPGPTGISGPWYWGPAIPATATTINPQVVTPTVNTQYCVTAKGVNGCYSSACINISALPVPTINAVANASVVCPGTGSQLSATGANTYTWAAPINQVTNNVTVYPNASTVYTVRGTATTNSCITTKTVQVQILSIPQITINPGLICPGVTNTLTASGANTYSWIAFPSPATMTTGPVYTINPAVTTTVTVWGYAPNSCFTSTTVILAGGPPNIVTVPNLTICSSSNSCATLSATSNYTSTPTYTWYPPSGPPLSGAQVTLCPSPNTSVLYTIKASAQAGCTASTTALVTSFTNCCTSPTAGLSILSNSIGGTYPPGSYLLNQSTTLSLTTNFIDSEVWITPGVQITVPPNTVLDLDKVHLFACSNTMWKGIVVQDGGRIKTSNTRKFNSLIEDAEIAVDLDQISTVIPNRPAIDLAEVIFNKNYIAIKISNSQPTLNVLPLGIIGCVFSSRTLTYTTFSNPPLNWPKSDMLPGSLRSATNPTTGLAPPYTFPGFAHSNSIKAPYTNQPSHIGIQISTIGLQSGCLPQSGVEIGYTYQGFITNNFNLFDGLGTGIEVNDASLITRDNVFQNMQYYFNTPSNAWYGGDGIKHTINTFMLSSLDVQGGGTTDDGNRFYDCINGINAKNVYQLTSNYNIFRSTHLSSTPFAINPQRGEGGIVYESNRVSFYTFGNEFNNLKYGIKFSTPNGMNGYNGPACNGVSLGVYANLFTIEHNYFGAEVTSSTPYSGPLNNTEYMYKGIEINTPNIFGWTNSGQNNYIRSNKFDRVFNGISIDGFADEPLAIGGNTLLIEDDYITGPVSILQFGQGIGFKNNMGNLTVEQNTLTAMNSVQGSNSVSLVYAETNYGIGSPKIFCNYASTSNFGFHFNSQNKGTIWEGNHMCNHWAGYALTNNGEIGQQGTPGLGSDNYWDFVGVCQNWGGNFAFNETYVDGTSNPLNSILYCTAFSGFNPTNNGAAFPSTPYQPNITIMPASTPNGSNIDCYLSNPYLAGPSWKNGPAAVPKTESNGTIRMQVFPNPTNGVVNLSFSSLVSNAQVKVTNLAGVVMYSKSVENSSSDLLDLNDLPNGVYFVELLDNSLSKIVNKLIINK